MPTKTELITELSQHILCGLYPRRENEDSKDWARRIATDMEYNDGVEEKLTEEDVLRASFLAAAVHHKVTTEGFEMYDPRTGITLSAEC